MRRIILVVVFVVAVLLANPAKASYFSHINKPFNTNGQWITLSGLNIELETTSPASGKIAFRLINNSSFACILTDIYFDDDAGILASTPNPVVATNNNGQVKFSLGADPDQLPNGNKLGRPFVTTAPEAKFSADSDQGQTKAAGVGDWVKITYTLAPGKTLANAD